MSSKYLRTASEAIERYDKIKLGPIENPKTKTYKGREYTFYGRAEERNSCSSKVMKIFQLMATSLLIPITLGIILAIKSFRNLLRRKFNKIHETAIKIYVEGKLKTLTKSARDLPEAQTSTLAAKKDEVPPAIDLKPKQEVLPPETKPKDIDPPLPLAAKKDEVPPAINLKPKQEVFPPETKPKDIDPPLPLAAKKDEVPPAIDLKPKQEVTPLETKNAKKDEIHAQDLSYEPKPNDTQVKKVQDYIEEGNLEEAIKANQKLPTLNERNSNYCIIAKVYFQQDNLEKAIEILDDRIISSKITNPIYKEFALTCCQKAKYEDSIKFIRKITYDDNLVGEIFLAVAEEHYQKGNLEKAVETVGHLRNLNVNGDEDFYLKIGKDYIDQGELDKAAETLKKIIYQFKEANPLFATLAQKYYDKKDLENALKYNIHNKKYGDTKILYIQIAQDYKNQGNDAKALDVLRTIVKHGRLVDAGNANIANDFLKKNDFKWALESIMRSRISDTLW